MAKQIKLKYQDKEYVLEYTRKSVERMENAGFVIGDVREKPLTTLPTLFEGAFLAHERWTKQETLDEIFEQIPDKQKFMEKLIEMYAETVETLFDEPEPSEKNAVWEPTW